MFKTPSLVPQDLLLIQDLVAAQVVPDVRQNEPGQENSRSNGSSIASSNEDSDGEEEKKTPLVVEEDGGKVESPSERYANLSRICI